MHLGPTDVLLTLSVDFADALPSEDVEALINRMEHEIKETYPEVRRLFIEAQSWRGHLRDLRRQAEEAGS
jgi:hypothetical protein